MENRTTIQMSDNLRKELRVLASRRDMSYQDLLKDMIDVFRELDREKTVVSIPSRLSEKIKSITKETDIKSVSEYVTFILRMVLAENIDLKKIDDTQISKKLKNLGYL